MAPQDEISTSSGTDEHRAHNAKAVVDATIGEYPRLLGYLRRRLLDAGYAEDLAQETYLRLLRVGRADLIRNQTAYLFQIADNLVKEFRVRQARGPVYTDRHAVDEYPSSSAPPEDLRARAELLEALQECIGALPKKYAAVLVMRKRDGYSHQEIADRLNVSVHTVRKYLTRAVGMCRRQMEKEQKET